MAFRFVPVHRGQHLIHEGYRYKRSRTATCSVYFICVKPTCKAKVTMNGAVTAFKSIPEPHNHPEDEAEIEYQDFLDTAVQTVRNNPSLSMKEVYDMVSAKFFGIPPPYLTIKSTLYRARAAALQPQSSADHSYASDVFSVIDLSPLSSEMTNESNENASASVPTSSADATFLANTSISAPPVAPPTFPPTSALQMNPSPNPPPTLSTNSGHSTPSLTPINQPVSAGEIQLYRVLQRGNLLGYYDQFIAQGGDDVQQLCEAGEEEFLEIVSLVGMSKKPLHVRRLQKTLQEWVTKPHLFNIPMSSTINHSMSQFANQNQPKLILPPPCRPEFSNSPTPSETEDSNSLTIDTSSGANGSYTSNTSALDYAFTNASGSPPFMSESQGDFSLDTEAEFQVSAEYAKIIRTCAKNCLQVYALSRNPSANELELNSSKMNRKIANDIEEVLKLPEDHPERMAIFRKYSAIYGRFDSKRKPGRKLTSHEVTINEAAAQICFIDKSFLARRDELFILARQVLRDSGYQFKARKHRANVKSETTLNSTSCNSQYPTMAKIPKYEPGGYTSNPNSEVSPRSSVVNQYVRQGKGDGDQKNSELPKSKSKLDNILETLRCNKGDTPSSGADSPATSSCSDSSGSVLKFLVENSGSFTNNGSSASTSVTGSLSNSNFSHATCPVNFSVSDTANYSHGTNPVFSNFAPTNVGVNGNSVNGMNGTQTQQQHVLGTYPVNNIAANGPSQEMINSALGFAMNYFPPQSQPQSSVALQPGFSPTASPAANHSSYPAPPTGLIPPQAPNQIWNNPDVTGAIPQDDLDCFVSAWTVANNMQQALVKNEPISP